MNEKIKAGIIAGGLFFIGIAGIVSNEVFAEKQEVGPVSQVIADTKWSDSLNIHWNHRVYLPKEYNLEENKDKEYPVVYMLHGWGGNVTNTTDPVRIDSQSILDGLIDSGEIEPMIVVFVDGFNSYYLDGPEFAMETAVVDDLIPLIDSTYRTIDKKEGRAISGISMGGFGSLNISLSNPDMFDSIGLMSPALWSEISSDHAIAGTPLADAYTSNSYEKILDKTKETELEIFVHHGKNDEIVEYKNVDNFVELAKNKGFEVEYTLKEEYPHAWASWRSMYPELFKQISEAFKR